MFGATILLALVFGLAAGSMATAIAHRIPRRIPIAGTRSSCPACGAQIGAADSIPGFSWLVLRGRARCCGTWIPPRYPLTEFSLAALFAITVWVPHESVAESANDFVFLTALAAVTLTDLERRIIPNRILLVATLLCFAIAAASDPGSLPERAVAAGAAGGMFWLVALARPEGMGLGDVKLAATEGLFLGAAVVPALLVALFSGTIFGLAAIARHGSGARKMTIPFGPFLALGGVVGMFVGGQLIDLYLGSAP
jgi:leader peptidase (prepilin peptidase)/N-methyltransferase